jgi:hypothetical protein
VRPICFMIMPYGLKQTQVPSGAGPAEIDFNALWDRAYVPVIHELGYEAIRADQDSGALILNQMLERLYFADLVLADMSIPNGNVYYELGIRHAAKKNGCVLLAADWSRQLFDVMQLRTIRYPLPEGRIIDSTAQAIRAAIGPGIPRLAAGISPMFELLKGYPLSVDMAAASTMKDQMADLAVFQGEVRAVRSAPRSERMQRALALAAKYNAAAMPSPIALGLLRLMRDSNDDDDPEKYRLCLDFMDQLSDELRALPEVREQRALALSNAKRDVEAIAELEAIIQTWGATPERRGLLGGRYKRLRGAATTPSERQRFLARAIEQYELGMDLDLNEYYCSSNLPRLYRERRRSGDEERAQSILRVVIAACQRAERRGLSDDW